MTGPVSISVITPVYNGAPFIGTCLASVEAQAYPCEHIVIDGGSTDGTLDVIRARAGRSTPISEPDRGVYDAMNKGIMRATGDVIGILNADDAYADETVLSEVARIFGEKQVESCYGDLIYVDGADTARVRRYWRSRPYHAKLFYRGWMPPHPTFFVRRSVYDRLGAFDERLGTAADYELMLRFLLKNGISTVYIPKTLVMMRTGGVSNRNVTRRMEANRMDRLAWKVNGLTPRPWTLTLKPLSKVGQWLSPYVRREAAATVSPAGAPFSHPVPEKRGKYA